ncbi:hypothetical protein ACJIZ3_021501 [Penstemon smallii]|uniref:Uncharacterized protein n=1 Tax=Penstemon smallii TaxID=265156 RepID=A0ABD3SMF8_9LAMI
MHTLMDYSPLEALALNYLSYNFLTAVNRVWAAVITAAAANPNPGEVSIPCDETKNNTIPLSTSKTASFCVLERQGSTKVKFTLHYKDDDFMDGDEGCDNKDNGGGEGGGRKNRRWCDDLERRMVMRMGDMGWYRCQDLTVLDGSVVRLWDGGRRRNAAA